VQQKPFDWIRTATRLGENHYYGRDGSQRWSDFDFEALPPAMAMLSTGRSVTKILRRGIATWRKFAQALQGNKSGLAELYLMGEFLPGPLNDVEAVFC